MASGSAGWGRSPWAAHVGGELSGRGGFRGIAWRWGVRLGMLLLTTILVACTPPRVRFQPGDVPAFSPDSPDVVQSSLALRQGILQQVPLSHEPRHTKRVEHVMSRLLSATPASNHWKVYVLAAPDWQAMTTPGSLVYVYTGILESLRSDDELAAVLAHEIAHRLAKHEVQSEEEQLGAVLTVLAGQVVANEMAKGGAAPAAIQRDAGLTMQVVKGLSINPYSRTKELEADLIGLFLMADAGFDPEKAARVWFNRARELQGSAAEVPLFLRTHPPETARFEFIASHMAQAKERYRAALKRSSSKQGAKRVQTARHVPTGESATFLELGKRAFANYDFSMAEKLLTRAMSLDTRSMEPVELLGLTQFKQGDVAAARRTLLRAHKIEPAVGSPLYNIACLDAMAGNQAAALTNLQKAVELDPSLRAVARTDADLFSLRDVPAFKALVSAGAVGGASFSINSL